ncbi:hypothetical protein N8I77_009777 [Diaporthe amygdali]|uniref:Protein kinase domain-containing protein n=1 Tax=Phomopsis amygdali TaxID=1214568 RepID=A0AAD9SBV7_PHOAM|nr:hypothetical protein N8I77_009777 [Diaporthe amygdali]
MTSKQDARIAPTTAATKPQAGGRGHPNHTRPPPFERADTPTASSKRSAVAIPQPSLPYVPGACFDIKPHKPPPAFHTSSGHSGPDPSEWDDDPWPGFEGAPSTIVELCLEHRPRRTSPPPDQASRRLQVTQQIRCGDPCNTQVVRCRVHGKGMDGKEELDGKDLVAKIFDSLYIGLEKCEEHECSPTYFAEHYYSSEAAAYIRIKEKKLDGKYTPRFEDCWFLELPLYDAEGRLVARREVRLILQQFIPGDTMEALINRGEVEEIDPKVRMGLLDRLMEAHSQLSWVGVQSNDLHPRNYMVSKDSNDFDGWQITLIDFSHSRVLEHPDCVRKDRPLPESPITTMGRRWPPRCQRWIPKESDCRSKESFDRRLKWMKKRWEGMSEYGPINSEWLPKPP